MIFTTKSIDNVSLSHWKAQSTWNKPESIHVPRFISIILPKMKMGFTKNKQKNIFINIIMVANNEAFLDPIK
jgi:hypothetical protein